MALFSSKIKKTKRQKKGKKIEITRVPVLLLPETVGVIAFAGMVVIVQETAESSSPVGKSISESKADQLPKLPS